MANCELFAKIFLPIFRYTLLAYAMTLAYSLNFSLPIAFTCMVCQNFPCQIFLCTIACMLNAHCLKTAVLRTITIYVAGFIAI